MNQQQISIEQLLMTIGKLHITVEAMENRIAELEREKSENEKAKKNIPKKDSPDS